MGGSDRGVLRRTGRSRAIDVATRRVVGTIRTFSPWSGLKIAMMSGVFCDCFSQTEHLVIEDELVVPHWSRRGEPTRGVFMYIHPAHSEHSKHSKHSEHSEHSGHSERHSTHSLIATVECPGVYDGVSVDVTAMFNARCCARSFEHGLIGTTELLAAMASESSNATLSALASDARSKLVVVMPDLREFSFDQGQPVVVDDVGR